MSPQVPRPSNAQGADCLRAGGFQKSLPERAGGARGGPSGSREYELWAEDEARLGLKPVMRRVWAPVGKRPVARFKRGYKWTYLYGFVRPRERRGLLADPAHGQHRAVLDGA